MNFVLFTHILECIGAQLMHCSRITEGMLFNTEAREVNPSASRRQAGCLHIPPEPYGRLIQYLNFKHKARDNAAFSPSLTFSVTSDSTPIC